MNIRKIEPVYKTSFDMKKDRERQNEEKRQLLLQKKRLIEEARKLKGVGTHIDLKI